MSRKQSFISSPNPYRILEISEDASDEDIKKAYRTLALKYHPDKHPNDPTANEKIREINYAHFILKDPTKRKIYDQYGPMGINMMNQIGEENMSIFLISQNKCFRFCVLAIFLLTCCCYGCFCCCMCCCNFCCGKFAPSQIDAESDGHGEANTSNNPSSFPSTSDHLNRSNSISDQTNLSNNIIDGKQPLQPGGSIRETAIPLGDANTIPLHDEAHM